ncbi:hypothetical protein CDAR_19531 [Caerostris darwini]|uniref:Uncharacterized protein n=1 Tax=Caerostris darwini TaxID=1538125 RepID=A0AAV4WCD2_9ARAC|nr:hypothetical protein CDAR_19531 [Caerostris darwini]
MHGGFGKINIYESSSQKKGMDNHLEDLWIWEQQWIIKDMCGLSRYGSSKQFAINIHWLHNQGLNPYFTSLADKAVMPFATVNHSE